MNIASNPNDDAVSYTYKGTVNSWIGIGRFVLGLPGQVCVEEPEAFRAYLRERVGEISW